MEERGTTGAATAAASTRVGRRRPRAYAPVETATPRACQDDDATTMVDVIDATDDGEADDADVDADDDDDVDASDGQSDHRRPAGAMVSLQHGRATREQPLAHTSARAGSGGWCRASTTLGAGLPCMQIAVCALSAISGFLFGYDLCVMVVALPRIQEAMGLSTSEAEAVVSLLMIGAVFGSLAGGVVADHIGRKPAIVGTGVLFFIGSVCMTFAGSLGALLAGRFVAGLAVGSSGPCVSVYIAEIARPESRGALVTVNEVMLCVGCLFSVLVSSALRGTDANDWRMMLGVTLLPPAVQLVGMPFMPESPRWLITRLQQKDRVQEARTVLRRLYPGSPVEETDAQIKAQLASKGLSISAWQAVREIVVNDVTRRRVVMSLLVALAHTLTGANAMLYYSSYIIESLNLGGRRFEGISKELGVAVAKLAGVCTAIAVVDRVGRRPLLLLGSAMMLVADLLFAVCFWSLEAAPGTDHETLGVWTLYIFIYAWNFSWAPLMWVVCSEVLPDDTRSIGMGLSFAVYWLGSSVVNQTLLSVFHWCGMCATFLVYAALTLCSLAFVYIRVPETKGMAFEEISAWFATPALDGH